MKNLYPTGKLRTKICIHKNNNNINNKKEKIINIELFTSLILLTTWMEKTRIKITRFTLKKIWKFLNITTELINLDFDERK